jgi:hypothetical protein
VLTRPLTSTKPNGSVIASQSFAGEIVALDTPPRCSAASAPNPQVASRGRVDALLSFLRARSRRRCVAVRSDSHGSVARRSGSGGHRTVSRVRRRAVIATTTRHAVSWMTWYLHPAGASRGLNIRRSSRCRPLSLHRHPG